MTEIRFDSSPYQRFLGLRLERAGDGEIVIRLPFRDEFLREDGSDWLHGGVMSALVDIAGDYAIVTRLGAGVPRRSTSEWTGSGRRVGAICWRVVGW